MQLPVLTNPNGITDVAERHLCAGCGVCAYMMPDTIEMIDTLESGRRPRATGHPPDGDTEANALRACPGIALEHKALPPNVIPELAAGWGPVLEIWEGYASDPALRFAGSSGGVSSALAIACMERGGMHGLLHIRARRDAPILNETVLSTSRAEILEATGSRYAPASPCDGLQLVEDAPRPCIVIGKPCDVAAVHKTMPLRPALRRRVGLTIALFCAGTPTNRATLALLERLGVEKPSDVLALRYRGNGWPGRTTVTIRTARGVEHRSLSYEESWGGVLTNDKQWRCHVCADHTGEFADIAVGDPWHRPIGGESETGRSLVLVRTERGRRILRQARAWGYVYLEPSSAAALTASQPNLLRGRGAVWGRSLACRLLGVPVPRYRGMPMFRFWWSELTAAEKMRTIAGTFRRALRRGLLSPSRPRPLDQTTSYSSAADSSGPRDETPHAGPLASISPARRAA